MTSSAQVLAYIPSPPRGVWELGPFPLRAYALFIIIGIIVAIYWGERRWIARGGDPGTILDVAIWAVPFGLIGGRLYHVATDWPTYFGDGKHPIDALKIWQGGLGIWGAVLFGALGAWIGCRQRGIPLPALGDAIAPAILLAQAIGRLGNYFNQELYGRETHLPWGLEIYQRFDTSGVKDDLNGISNGVVAGVVHPTFLYELLWNLIVVGLLVLIDKRFKIGHGRLFALYVALYCVGRFGVELLRVDHASHIAGIRINLFTSVIVFVLAVAYVIFAKKGREDPADLKSVVALAGSDSDESEESDESDEIVEIIDEDETEVPTVIAPPKRGGLFKRGGVAEKEVTDDDAWVESLKADAPAEAEKGAPEPTPAVGEDAVDEPEPEVVAPPKGGLFKRTPKPAPAVVEDAAPEPEPEAEPEPEPEPEPVKEPEPEPEPEVTEPEVAVPMSKQEGRLSGLIRRVRGN
ncbi:prolipoprotein diacylglyceryl transferase [Nocardiaceae bacterium YC2-7]|uniref:Phosphatidylglycerol--prolipoprotein diacylglyceryl transferase n=1 Tax=Antrihabitans stalactiti TaxID=2584121 RepID=A0A848KCS7_9NOCA|nr:prolipoprotein diacylglyceryl transferase [Antrihabitans stalactiti]